MYLTKNPQSLLGAMGLSLLLAMTGVYAGQTATGDESEERFVALDSNHDGTISPEEAEASPGLAAEFAAADENRDNKLDKTEFARFEVSDDH